MPLHPSSGNCPCSAIYLLSPQHVVVGLRKYEEWTHLPESRALPLYQHLRACATGLMSRQAHRHGLLVALDTLHEVPRFHHTHTLLSCSPCSRISNEQTSSASASGHGLVEMTIAVEHLADTSWGLDMHSACGCRLLHFSAPGGSSGIHWSICKFVTL